MIKYKVTFFDEIDCWIDTKDFITNSKEELKIKINEHIKLLTSYGLSIEYWDVKQIKEEKKEEHLE